MSILHGSGNFSYGKRRDRNDQDGIWPNHARRCVVASTAIGLSRLIDFHRLLPVGGVSGSELFLRQLHLAVLFARIIWRFAPQLVWTEARLVAAVASIFAGTSYSLGTGRLPADLLLLPWRLLQGVLG